MKRKVGFVVGVDRVGKIPSFTPLQADQRREGAGGSLGGPSLQDPTQCKKLKDISSTSTESR